jgi:chromosome partitioning protein
MKIITIATQKGGAGKTTIATNLAVASSICNKITLLIDADSRQRTSLEWFLKRENKENPMVIEAENQKDLFKILDLAKRKKVDRVFIDTQGADAPLVNDAISKSDYCLIPCGSGGFDISAQRTTAEVVKRLRKNASFVVTKSPPRGKEVEETKSILTGLGFGSAKQKISNLKAYKDAAICSLSVLEYEPQGKAANEIKGLFQWVEKQMIINPILSDLQTEVYKNEE